MQEEPRVCHMHGGVYGRRFGPLPALHAHLPRRVHRRLADEELHLPFVHGARRIGPLVNLRSQLTLLLLLLLLQASLSQLLL